MYVRFEFKNGHLRPHGPQRSICPPPLCLFMCASACKACERGEKWRKNGKGRCGSGNRLFLMGERAHTRQTRPPFSIFGRINDIGTTMQRNARAMQKAKEREKKKISIDETKRPYSAGYSAEFPMWPSLPQNRLARETGGSYLAFPSRSLFFFLSSRYVHTLYVLWRFDFRGWSTSQVELSRVSQSTCLLILWAGVSEYRVRNNFIRGRQQIK